MADEIKKEAAETSKSKPEKAKKAAAKKTDDKKSGDKKQNVFVRMGKAIAKFFKDERGECKKIVWPDRKTVLKSSLVVIVTVAILGVVIW